MKFEADLEVIQRTNLVVDADKDLTELWPEEVEDLCNSQIFKFLRFNPNYCQWEDYRITAVRKVED